MDRHQDDLLAVDFLETLPVMAVATRAAEDGPVLAACNETFAERLGYEVEALVGKPLSSVYESESAERLTEGGYARALDEGLTAEARTLVTSAGDTVDTLVRAVPRVDERDEVIGTWVLFVDVTERAAQERAVRTLYDLTWEFFEAEDAAGVVEALGWTTREVLGYPNVEVHLAENGSLVPAAAAGVFDPPGDPLDVEDDDPVVTSFRKGEITVLRDGEPTEPRRSDREATQAGVGELLYLPLGDYGVLSVGTDVGETFSSDDVDLGILVARNARLALDHLTDEQSLREHEQRLRAFIQALTRLLEADATDDALEAAITSLSDLFDGQIAALWEYDREARALRPVASTAAAHELFDGVPRLGEESLSWRVFHEGEPTTFADVRAEPEVHDEETPIRSELIIPVGDYGVLNVGSTEVGAFDELDRSLAELVATTTGVVLSRSETDRRLRAAHERLSFALEGTGTGMFEWDPDTDTVVWGESLARLFDLPAPEVASGIVDRVRLEDREDAETFLTRIHEADRDEVATTLVAATAGADGPHVSQFRTRSDDDTVQWLSLRVNIVPDGDGSDSVVGFCTDITEQVREEERFEALIAHSSDVVLVVDNDRRIRYVSPTGRELLRRDSGGLVGADPLLLVHEDDAGRVRDVLTRVIDGKARGDERVECRVRRADGSWMWFELATSTHRHDAIDGYVLNARDITRRKRQEKQLEMLNRVIRHNVRNDLNIIDGFAGELLEHDDPSVRGMAARIRRTTTKWMRLSEKVREIERQVDSADRSETVPARTACERVHARLGGNRGDRVTVGRVDNVPVPVAIVAALVELCENGFKHAGTHDVTVELSIVAEPDHVSLQVVDDGPGIPDSERQVLEEGRETPLVHGSGLGSWLVHMTTAALGGEVTVDAGDDDHGSAVIIRLPRVSG